MKHEDIDDIRHDFKMACAASDNASAWEILRDRESLVEKLLDELAAFLSECARVHEAATPAQWFLGGPYPGVSVCFVSDPGIAHEMPPTWEPIAILSDATEGEPCTAAQANARAIAHYHNTYAALLDVARGLVEWRAVLAFMLEGEHGSREELHTASITAASVDRLLAPLSRLAAAGGGQ